LDKTDFFVILIADDKACVTFELSGVRSVRQKGQLDQNGMLRPLDL
jgi:hypothetical protein